MRFILRRETDFILPSSETIIDGRILMVLKTGFIRGTVVLPQFLIDYFGKQVTSTKTNIFFKRGDMVLETLMSGNNYNILIEKTEVKNLDGINRKIVKLALIKHYKLLAADNELDDFAKVAGVDVLKLKQLTISLKHAFFKGDIIHLKPIKKGKHEGEGIGYLDDNSRVVIEGAATSLGKVVRCEVNSVLDIPNGRVIFTKIVQ